MANKTVYAVIVSHEFEGYSEPAGIFTSFEKAVELRDQLLKHRDVDIFEYILDQDNSGCLC